MSTADPLMLVLVLADIGKGLLERAGKPKENWGTTVTPCCSGAAAPCTKRAGVDADGGAPGLESNDASAVAAETNTNPCVLC